MVSDFIDFISDFYLVPVIVVVGISAGYFLAIGPHLILSGIAAVVLTFSFFSGISPWGNGDFVLCLLVIGGTLLFVVPMWVSTSIAHVDWATLGDGLLSDGVRSFLFR